MYQEVESDRTSEGVEGEEEEDIVIQYDLFVDPIKAKRKVRKRKKSKRATFEEGLKKERANVRCRRYDLACQYLNRASEAALSDRGSLGWRSSRFLHLLEADTARAEAVTSLERFSITGPSKRRTQAGGLMRQAQKMFEKDELEASLVLFNRAAKLRPSAHKIRRGAMLAKEAIIETIGEKSNHFEEISYLYPVISEYLSKHLAETRPPNVKRTESEFTGPRGNKSVTVLTEEFPDGGAPEKNYLLAVPLGSRGRSQEVLGTVVQIAEFMNKRQELWQRQRPFCRPRKARLEDVRMTNQRQVRVLLAEMEEALSERNHLMVQQVGSDLQRFIAETPETQLPCRKAYTIRSNNYLSLAHTQSSRCDLAMALNEIMLRDAKELEDPMLLALVYSTMGKTYATSANFKLAAEAWENMLPLVDDQEIKAWLFHELGRCYFQMEEVDKARQYGGLSLEAAKEAECDHWSLNALILIGQTEMHRADYSAALIAFHEAKEYSTTLRDLRTHRYILEVERTIATSSAPVVSLSNRPIRNALTLQEI